MYFSSNEIPYIRLNVIKENDESSSSNIEVIADDLGSRTIPTAVAFRHSTSPGNSHRLL